MLCKDKDTIILLIKFIIINYELHRVELYTNILHSQSKLRIKNLLQIQNFLK